MKEKNLSLKKSMKMRIETAVKKVKKYDMGC